MCVCKVPLSEFYMSALTDKLKSNLYVEPWRSLKMHGRGWRKESREFLRKNTKEVCVLCRSVVWGWWGGGSFQTPPQVIVYTDSSAFSYIHHVHTVQLCHTTDHQRYIQPSNLFSDRPPPFSGLWVNVGLGLNELVFKIPIFHNNSYSQWDIK